MKPAQLQSLVPSAKIFITQRGGEVYEKDLEKAYGRLMIEHLEKNKLISRRKVRMVDTRNRYAPKEAVVIKLL